ncbi:hypothetical protein ASE63_23760 [Bosea sp. Root381]|uniref:hypothetical protein n=1 Tax=Bosea sp. Root381 TaxID=1736524 RepID=UPI0006FBF574|nr:hypothetical protein [Bosea sp. Root381]KRE06726.1 hypothetical protein ASE63_23760 [Bosea sp. Root381]
MDATRKRGLARLMLRWPDRRAALKERFLCDPSVSELCEAYETACEAVAYWAKSHDAVANERSDEYRSLAAETEKDILRLIS